jgi:murein DD-endopeptidase MepM/ murein hydrolase activator NlpD
MEARAAAEPWCVRPLQRIIEPAMRRLAQAAAVAALPLLAATAAAAPGQEPDRAAARAVAVRIVLPGGEAAGTAEVTAPPDAVQFAGGFAFPEDGSIVATGPVTASVTATAGDHAASASAASEATSVSLFGGEVTVERAVGRAVAGALAGDASGSTEGSTLVGLVVAGTPVDAPAGQIVLGDWGTADVLVEGSATEGGGHRGFATALAVRLTADHAGLPAGTEILVGHVEASASAAAPPQPAPPRAVTPPTAAQTPPLRTLPLPRAHPPAPPRGPSTTVPPIVRRPLPSLVPKLTKKGYVFPVHGPVSFVDTFGSARAAVGWHHGEDLFAPLGAPVLAVAAGQIFAVGWNDVGGNRLWLRDRDGNEFYYAHLSAFSPLAVQGARVRSGDVIGFVGNSGDAEATPPHLHFEIHPVGLLALGYDGVVNPYPYLRAWERLDDVGFIAGATWVPSLAQASSAPTPGAFLLDSTDIADTTDLGARELARVLARRASAGA